MKFVQRAAVLGGTLGVTAAIAGVGTCGVAGARIARAQIGVPSPAVQPSTATPSTFAGFEGTVTGTSGVVSATITVPTLKCRPNTTEPDLIDVAINGVFGEGVSTFDGVQFYLSCDAGESVSLIQNAQVNSSTTVRPGDVISAVESASATSNYESFTDKTSGVAASLNGAGLAPSQYLFSVRGGFNDGGKFAGFTPFTFSKALVNSVPLADAAPERYDEVNASQQTQIETSNLSNGKQFTETFIKG